MLILILGRVQRARVRLAVALAAVSMTIACGGITPPLDVPTPPAEICAAPFSEGYSIAMTVELCESDRYSGNEVDVTVRYRLDSTFPGYESMPHVITGHIGLFDSPRYWTILAGDTSWTDTLVVGGEASITLTTRFESQGETLIDVYARAPVIPGGAWVVGRFVELVTVR